MNNPPNVNLKKRYVIVFSQNICAFALLIVVTAVTAIVVYKINPIKTDKIIPLSNNNLFVLFRINSKSIISIYTIHIINNIQDTKIILGAV